MARPIRNTPILTGLDAAVFNKEAEIIPSIEVRKAERDRLNTSVRRFETMLANLPL